MGSMGVQNLNVPLQTQEDADSLSDASGFSIASTTNSPLRGDFSNRGGIKSFTALILETIEDNETMYYLIPKHLAKRGKLKKRGTKCHKECFDKTQDICTQSTLQSLELKYIIQEKR